MNSWLKALSDEFPKPDFTELKKTILNPSIWEVSIFAGLVGGISYWYSHPNFDQELLKLSTLKFELQTTALQLIIEAYKRPTNKQWFEKLKNRMPTEYISKIKFNPKAFILSTLETGFFVFRDYMTLHQPLENFLFPGMVFYTQFALLNYYLLDSIGNLNTKNIKYKFNSIKYLFLPSSKKKWEFYKKSFEEGLPVSPKKYLSLSKKFGDPDEAYYNFIKNTFIEKRPSNINKQTRASRRNIFGFEKFNSNFSNFLYSQYFVVDERKQLQEYYYERLWSEDGEDTLEFKLEKLVPLAIYTQQTGKSESKDLFEIIGKLAYLSKDFKKEKFAPGTLGVNVIKHKKSKHAISLLILEKTSSTNKTALSEEFKLSEIVEKSLRAVPKRTSPIVFNYNSTEKNDYFNLVLFHQETIYNILPSLTEEQQRILFAELLDFNKLKAKIYSDQNEVKLEKIDLDKKLLTIPLIDSKEYIDLTKENNQRLEELDEIHFGPLTDSHTQNYLGPKILFDKEGKIDSLTTIDHSNKGIGPKIFEFVNTFDFNFYRISFRKMELMRPFIIYKYQEDTGAYYQKTIETYLSGLIARRDAFTKAWMKGGRQEDFLRIWPLLDYSSSVLSIYKDKVSRESKAYFSKQASMSLNLKNILLGIN